MTGEVDPNAAGQTPPAGEQNGNSGAPATPAPEGNAGEGAKVVLNLPENTPPADGAKPGEQNGNEPPKDGEQKPKEGEGEKSEGAPETYEDFKLAEGIVAAPEMMEAAKGLFKKHNLTQEAAQDFVNLQNEFALKQAAEQAQAWEATLDQWAKECRESKTFGGGNFDKSVADAKKAIATFGNVEAMEQMFALTGVGNNPVFFEFCANIGKHISEAQMASGGAAPATQKTREQIMYPNTPSN